MTENPNETASHPRPVASLRELIVITGLCLVMALLLGQIVGVLRGRQGGAICLSNLRCIGQATHLYLQDNDETFPPAWSGCVAEEGWRFATWPQTLTRYTGASLIKGASGTGIGGTVWHCPADGSGDSLSYATNPAVAGAFATRDCHRAERSALWQASLRLSQVALPEQVVWAGDTNKEWLADEGRYGAAFADWMRSTDAPVSGRTSAERRIWYDAYLRTDYTDTRGDCPYPGRYGCKAPAYRHDRNGTGTGSANLLFCDGHAASVAFGTLTVDNLFPKETAR